MLKNDPQRNDTDSRPPQRQYALTCAVCQHYDDKLCHRLARRVEPAAACPSWEQRRERDGLTVWEVLAREG